MRSEERGIRGWGDYQGVWAPRTGRSGVGRINLRKEDPFSKQAKRRKGMGTYTRMELSSVKMKKFPFDGAIFSIK